MSKRKWTNVSMYSEEIEQMRSQGRTRQEIADMLGLSKVQIKNWVNRKNRTQTRIEQGQQPKAKGRPRKDGQPPKQDVQKELARLRMENQLLRDFLGSIGRGSGQG